jgi:hypothetical protein
MIIEKPVAEGDVVALKLITGDEVVGKLVTSSALDITLSRPLTAHQVQTDTGIGIMFGPFMSAGEAEKVKLLKSACITDIVKARAEIRTKYISLTTGLDVPPQSPGISL